jgi:hypothetical protein
MINGVSLNNYIIDSPAGYDVAVNEVFQEKEAFEKKKQLEIELE